MKLSKLIKILQAAKKQYGDVSVSLVNGETGSHIPIKNVQKTHPYTGQYGCINRNEPVNGIVLLDHYYDSDLNLGEKHD